MLSAIWTATNTKEHSAAWKELTPDGNLDLQGGIKSTRNNKYVDKYKRQYFFLLTLKDIW